jgi:cell division protein FtsN
MEQELPSATADPFAPSAAEAARQAILRRLTAGLLLVAGLAGVWVLIDTLPTDAPATPPAKTAKTVRQAGGVIPAEQRPAAVTSSSVASAPAVAPASSAPAQPVTSPATSGESADAPVSANPAAPVVPASPGDGAPASAATPRSAAASPAVAVEATRGEAEVVVPSATPRKKPTPRTAARHASAGEQFAVQMGVFKVIDNAEKLRAKMALSDMPVLFEKQATETRVLAGPFVTRAQALQARDDMEKSGLGKGMLVPLKK